MDLDYARTFLAEHHHSIIATTRADGSTQMTPVLQCVGDDGSVMISSRETAFKVHHIRRSPGVALCVIPDGFFGQWVQVEGRAEIVSLPEAMELLVVVYRRTTDGEHPNWDEYREAMVKEQRCIVRVIIERAGPDRRG